MSNIAAHLEAVRARIGRAERDYGRAPGSVALVAVTKTRSVADIETAVASGQRLFGESYVQEALDKIDALSRLQLEWHFIGAIQANKTREIATQFTWVHSVDRIKIAQRLNEQRPKHLPALNVCLQVNLSREITKAGVRPEQLRPLAAAVAELPRLRLRGLMVIPAPASGFAAQRRPFRDLRAWVDALNAAGFGLDSLSMGMSNDMEAAIAEGATLVRIGTDIFGARTG